MPKERREKSLQLHRRAASPYAGGSKNTDRIKPRDFLKSFGDEKQWEEVRCPICMEHPHNAVLLICSSFGNGCRPYMCDTSHRLSNCFDQFLKSSSVAFPEDSSQPEVAYHRGGMRSTFSPFPSTVHRDPRRRGQTVSEPFWPTGTLFCPLCRGQIHNWTVVEPARRFMNTKSRSCSLETCDFTGNYAELRKHARLQHPLLRPSEVDPRRQSDWARFESQRDLEDTISAYRPDYGLDDRADDLLLGTEEFLVRSHLQEMDHGIPLEFFSVFDEIQESEDSFFDLTGISFQFEDEEVDDGASSSDLEYGQPFSLLSDFPLYSADDSWGSGVANDGTLRNRRSTRPRQVSEDPASARRYNDHSSLGHMSSSLRRQRMNRRRD